MKPADKIKTLAFEDMNFWFSPEKPIFNKVTVELPANQVVLIEGNSGSGKSTLLKIFAGLANPVGGGYLMNGVNVNEFSFEEFIPWRLKIGYCFDLGGLMNNRSLRENLTLPMYYHKVLEPDQIESWTSELLNIFGLREYELLRPSSVTGSKRKATIVARSLAMIPDVLLLDEPTIGLDHRQRRALIDFIILQRRSGKLNHVFISSSDREFTRAIVTDEIYLRDLNILKNEDPTKVAL